LTFGLAPLVFIEVDRLPKFQFVKNITSHSERVNVSEGPSQLDLARREYDLGLAAFERGDYRQSVQCFEKAVSLANQASSFGGEIQIWLVNAYAAANQMPDAINLGRKLFRHPDFETRKQSRRLVYILEAPKLKTRPEWLSEIPDLSAIANGDGQEQLSSLRYAATPKKPRSPRPQPEPEPIDRSQVNTKDNQFIWLALIAAAVILGGLLWLG
jgi:tetratricopeptide (TPR) repeat protein